MDISTGTSPALQALVVTQTCNRQYRFRSFFKLLFFSFEETLTSVCGFYEPCMLKLLNQMLFLNFLNRKNVFRLRIGFSS